VQLRCFLAFARLLFHATFSALTLILPLFVALAFLAPQVWDEINTELRPATLAGFSRYVGATETRIGREVADLNAFLYVDRLSAGRRNEVLAALRHGQTFMERLETSDACGEKIEAPNALIHHWVGDLFIPGASLHQVLEFMQDYDHHQDFFKPELVRSRLIGRNGNDFKIFYRLVKHQAITVTLNTEHDVHYTRVDNSHWYNRSISTRIAEVADAGTSNEHEKAIGHDGGFLWRINSYWRLVQRDRGVYVECESISLTRAIPTGLGWLLAPLVTSVPKESLQHTLESVRSGVVARAVAAQKP
jgi:hypothetical protein